MNFLFLNKSFSCKYYIIRANYLLFFFNSVEIGTGHVCSTMYLYIERRKKVMEENHQQVEELKLEADKLEQEWQKRKVCEMVEWKEKTQKKIQHWQHHLEHKKEAWYTLVIVIIIIYNYTNLEILAIDHSMHNFNTIYYIEHKEAINMVHTIIIQY